MDKRTLLSLYFHIPFCEKKCSYCDFYSIPLNKINTSTYIENCKTEINKYAFLSEGRIVSSLYFGGGSPSILNPDCIRQLLDLCSSQFSVGENAEITLEANPKQITREKLSAWKKTGINRLSVGIQSFKKQELKILGRIHNQKESEDVLDILQEDNFQNYNMDLIFGIPGQSLSDWEQTLKKTSLYRPKHLSVYGLTAEKETPLHKRIKQKELKMPCVSLYNKMFLLAHNYLEKTGYRHYEISNYCLPAFHSKHNSHYWKGNDYLGFGAAAHSSVGDERWANVKDVEDYENKIQKDEFPLAWKEKIRPQNRIHEIIMLGLRTFDGINLEMLNVNGFFLLQKKQKLLEKLCASGFLKVTSNSVCATLKGMTVLDELITQIME
jgi:oxygen-independent coproporphyrinogen-3 oxidase